jgi:hypothetical protein
MSRLTSGLPLASLHASDMGSPSPRRIKWEGNAVSFDWMKLVARIGPLLTQPLISFTGLRESCP